MCFSNRTNVTTSGNNMRLGECVGGQYDLRWRSTCIPSGPQHPPKAVLFVRHGEAQHNLKRKKGVALPSFGALGPALTPAGKEQAVKAAQQVRESFESLAASPYKA